MLIAYCEKCGTRVPDAPADAPPSGVYCKTCAPTLPVAGRSGTSGRQKTPGKGSGILLAAKRGEPAAQAKARGAAPAAQTSNSGMWMGLGGLGIGLLIGAFFAFGGSKPEQNVVNKVERNSNKPATTETAKTTPKTEPQPAKTEPKPEPKTAPAVTKTEPKFGQHDEDETAKSRTKPPQVEVVDVREEFAARKWKDLLAAENTTKMPAYELRQQVEAFAKSYANTKPGKEAADWLQKTPAVAPPPPPPTNTLVNINFDFDSDFKCTKLGTKDATTSYGGKGFSLKSAAIDDPKNYFGGHVVIQFDEKPIIVTKDTWVRFAYKAENAGSFCFHSIFNDSLYEAYVANTECGKWKWATLKMGDYKRAIRGEGLPAPGMQLKSIAVLFARKGDKTTVYVDNFTVGEGPVPEDPKE